MVNRISNRALAKLTQNWAKWYNKLPDSTGDDWDKIPEDEPIKRRNGLYMTVDYWQGKMIWTGCDNTEGFCWCEDFDNEQTCIDWLEGRCDSDGTPIIGGEDIPREG